MNDDECWIIMNEWWMNEWSMINDQWSMINDQWNEWMLNYETKWWMMNAEWMLNDETKW